MTAFLQTMASFLALCALSALVARHTRLPAALAPLPVCCGAMVFLVAAGYLRLLLPAAVLLLCAGAGAALYLLCTAKRGGFRKLLAPGFVLFCVAGTVFLVLFAVRRPLAQGWDEFSLWATAVKLTREHHVIFSEAPMDWPWIGTQKPGLPTFSYFFNLLGSYAAWRVYAAYAVLLCAVWAAVLGTLSWKHWKLVVPGAAVMFLLPYFSVYLRDIYFNYLYLSSYADIPLGILCGGALAWYFHVAALRRQSADSPLLCVTPGVRLCGAVPRLPAAVRGVLFGGGAARVPLWPLALMTAAITLCKDTGLPLALIVAGIAFADLLFCAPRAANGGAKAWRPRVWLPKTGLFLLWAAGALLVFMVSSQYIASLGVAQGSVSTTGDGSEVSQGAMLLEGTKLLLGLAPGPIGAQYTEKFALIRDEMVSLFLPGALHGITIVGCGLYVLLLVWCLLALGALLSKRPLWRRSMLLYGAVSTLGFFAYYIFIGFTYVFVFKGEGLEAMRDYNRYIVTYYLLWVCGAFALLVLAAAQGSRWGKRTSLWLAVGGAALGGILLLTAGGAVSRRLLVAGAAVYGGAVVVLLALRRVRVRWRDCLTPVVLAVAVLFALRFHQMVQPQLCVIDYPDVVYSEVRETSARAEAVKAQLQPGDHVYYVNSADDGLGWFRNSYEFLPWVLKYSNGGGNFADLDRAETDTGAVHRSMEEFAAEVSRCDYVFVDRAHSSFWEGYGALFADGGNAFVTGETLLYRVELSPGAQYEPVRPQDVKTPEELDESGNVLDIPPGQMKATKREKLQNAAQVLTLVPVEMEVPAV